MGPDMPVCLPSEVVDDADYLAFEKAFQDMANAVSRSFLDRSMSQWGEPLMSITVYSVGTLVLVGDDIEGVITAVMVRGEVSYEVSWWNGRERQQQLFQDCEMKVVSDKKTTIGFKAAVGRV